MVSDLSGLSAAFVVRVFCCMHKLFSPDLICLSSVDLHLGRSAARSSQDRTSISRAFMSLFTTSLNRSCGCPVLSFPVLNSPYKMSLGIRPSSIRCTCRSQHNVRCRSIVNILGRFARDRTSVLGTLSCHEMPRMRRRHRYRTARC